MTGHTPTPWPKPEYANDVGPQDEGFWQWWEIEGIAKFDKESDALFAWRACNSHEALVEALGEVMEWIRNWDPNFIYDDEWPDTEVKARTALEAAGKGDG